MKKKKEEKEKEKEKENEYVFKKDVGNVTSESAFTVEYAVNKSNMMTKENLKLTCLPFQLHIRYTKLNGMKCIRIISKVEDITWDTTKAEKEANVDVLGLNAVQTTARMAQEGHYTLARFQNFTYQDLITRTATSDSRQQARATNWANQANNLESELQTVQMQERDEGLFLDDDDDDEDDDSQNNDQKKEQSKNNNNKEEARKQLRKQRRTDSTSQTLWTYAGHRKGGKF